MADKLCQSWIEFVKVRAVIERLRLEFQFVLSLLIVIFRDSVQQCGRIFEAYWGPCDILFCAVYTEILHIDHGFHIAGLPGEAGLDADHPGAEGGGAGSMLLDIFLDILLYFGSLLCIFLSILLDNLHQIRRDLLRALKMGLYDKLQLFTFLHDGCYVWN